MEVLAKPDSASVVVDEIDERKVHLGIRFLSKTRLLCGLDRSPPCTVSGHEPNLFGREFDPMTCYFFLFSREFAPYLHGVLVVFMHPVCKYACRPLPARIFDLVRDIHLRLRLRDAAAGRRHTQGDASAGQRGIRVRQAKVAPASEASW